MKKTIILFLFIGLLSWSINFINGAAAAVAPSNSTLPEASVNGATGSAVTTPQETPVLTNPIKIVQPVENATLPAIAATFVCGSAPSDGQLTLNGQPVLIHPDGGFVAMVDLAPGKFEIKAELTLGTTTYRTTRTVYVAAPEQPAPVTPLTIEYVTPRQNLELQVGDTVTVVCKGSPGMAAYFKIEGVRKKFPLLESDTGIKGIYQGVYRVAVKDRLKQSLLEVTLTNPEKQKISQVAAGVLTRFPRNHPVIAVVNAPDVVLKSGPALSPDDKAGYQMFPPPGTLLQLTGRIGNEYRVRLNDNQALWVSTDQVKQLPKGTPLPRVVVGNLAFSRVQNSVLLRIPLGEQIPFKVDADSEGKYLDLTLFGAYANTDRIANTATGIVKQVSWFQDDRETYRLRVNTAPNSWWGYDVRYEGRELVLELRTPPPLPTGGNPLSGLIIAIDAGHGSGGGAIGTTGYSEGEANLAIAAQLQAKLLAKGAQVILTRPTAAEVPLMDRPKIAWQQRADLLISVHNNALGVDGNPLLKHGFEIYYFTPMSFSLAQEIHGAYRETFGAGRQFELPDGGLYYGNLALVRGPQMPSVLVESAYMIYPAEEAYLKTAEFQGACADAMVSGLERYAGRMRGGER
jgi:N-acetylmuramoyl-L-alanine amidase